MKLTLLLVFGLSFAAAARADDQRDNGRFQIINSNVEAYSQEKRATTTIREQMVFKIDTQTGRTWHYWISLKDGKLIQGWKEDDQLE